MQNMQNWWVLEISIVTQTYESKHVIKLTKSTNKQAHITS